MIEIMVFPSDPGFIKFLATRGVVSTEDNPRVIHYFGTSYNEVYNLIRKKKIQLAVIHRPLDVKLSYKTPFSFVFDPIREEKDIYQNTKVATNNIYLCELHYQSLGLNRNIEPIYPPEEELVGPKKSLVGAIKKFMLWA
jgi:hypothetical protein